METYIAFLHSETCVDWCYSVAHSVFVMAESVADLEVEKEGIQNKTRA